MRADGFVGGGWFGGDEVIDVDERVRVVVSVEGSIDGRLTFSRERLLMLGDNGARWESFKPASAWRLAEAIESLHEHQATLAGSGSLVADDAGPLQDLPAVDGAVHEDFLPAASVDRDGRTKWFVVPDSRGRVRWHTKSQGEFDVLVLVSRATPADYLGYLRDEGICYVVTGDERVDLAQALAKLRDRLGVSCAVSTGGGALNAALLRDGLVDEVNVIVLPMAIGGVGTPSVFDGSPLGMDELPVRLRLVSSQAEDDGAVWLRYEVVDG